MKIFQFITANSPPKRISVPLYSTCRQKAVVSHLQYEGPSQLKLIIIAVPMYILDGRLTGGSKPQIPFSVGDWGSCYLGHTTPYQGLNPHVIYRPLSPSTSNIFWTALDIVCFPKFLSSQ